MAEPVIETPLPVYIKEAAREAARTVIEEHVESCAARQDIEKIDKRVVVLEKRFNILIGAIIGSGALGGGVAATIMKLVS